MVRWPGHVAAGATDPRPVGLLDIAPSVFEAAALTPPLKYPLDGRSFLAPAGRPESLLEYHYSPDFANVPSWASIRSQSFQYVEWYQEPEGTASRPRWSEGCRWNGEEQVKTEPGS